MHRLLVPAELLNQDGVLLPKDAARHLKVLRPKPGEEIELFDGRGRTRVYRCGGETLTAVRPCVRFPARPLALVLFACVTKGSRWDWTIEKAVELGVARIVPVISARCIVRLARAERAAKAERWRRIAEDAARQSDAVWLPEVAEAVDFAAALEQVKVCDRTFVGALTDPAPAPLAKCVADFWTRNGGAPRTLGLFVGPEGDFTPAELDALLDIATPASFGPTILRAETAAIFGLSVLAAVCHAERAS
ncbi:MAG: RsmE family RNA methyltransferase [Kiritimatiellia bacterium]